MENLTERLYYLTGTMHSIRQFFLSPPLATGNISIHGIGIREPMPPCTIDRPEGTPDYLLMLFWEPVVLKINGKTEILPANTMMIWEPESCHFYGYENASWHHSWLHCNGNRINDLIANYNIPLNKPFVLGEPGRVDHYLWEIYREVTVNDAPIEQVVDNALHSWFIEMRRQIDGGGASVPAPLLSVKHYMGAHFSEPLTLAALAMRVNLSASHFSNQFRHYYGVSPIDYLIQLRLQYAANLLRDGNMSVAQVAQAVGYSDAFHFSKQFKRRFGQSPRDMRPASSANVVSGNSLLR